MCSVHIAAVEMERKSIFGSNTADVNCSTQQLGLFWVYGTAEQHGVRPSLTVLDGVLVLQGLP